MPALAASPNNGRYAFGGVLALTVAVFGAVVAVVTLQLRRGLREQLLQREADTLVSAVSMQLDNTEGVGDSRLADTGELLYAALKTSRFPEVVAVRVFDASQRPGGAFPWPWSGGLPNAADWARLAAGETVARVHPQLLSEDVVGLPVTGAPRPAVEAWVPLRRSDDRKFIGAAQYWVKGERFALEMARHDDRLWQQALLAWFVGSLVITAGLTWAFGRLARANAELRARSEDLLRANRELMLAAKTSALGAVTAHLMHELKNPLAGLELLVGGKTDAATGEGGATGSELAAASELTRRLRSMVNDVVGVLRDEQTGAEFELTAADIVEIVAEKVRPDAAERGVNLVADGGPPVALPGRRGNLATLVLRNLLQNALEATPAGGRVRVGARSLPAGEVEFVVEDAAGGLPASVRARLFQPCASTKPGGSGLGLALSYQLAQQAGGRLELARSDERGTSFRLVLPAEA